MKRETAISTNLFLLLAVTFICVTFTFRLKPQPKETNLVVYVHDYFTGEDTTAITVGGRKGLGSSILNFGSIAVVDDLVTEGPSKESKKIGRAQGMYWNSQLDGKAVYMVFSVIFTEGEFKESSLDILGYDSFNMKQREFGITSGTGYFRYVKGDGIMETEFMDMANLRAIIKLTITVKHY